MNVLGIMNGTSIDGVDYVWIQISKSKKIKFLKHVHKSFSKKIQNELKKASLNISTSYDIGELHHNLGREYQKHLKSILNKQNFKTHLIGLHGQTIYHRGKKASFQIGEPSYISESTNIPVIYNFRSADIARGGEGAPFAPAFHNKLLNKYSSEPVVFQNLGGIGNATYIHKSETMAFDTGPANVLMDLWIQLKRKKHFDKNGMIASKGIPNYELIESSFLKHPYFKGKPPKSCGREEFNINFINEYGRKDFKKLNFNDQMATLAELSVVSIYNSYEKFLPKKPTLIIFSGGGTKNAYLMKRFKIHLSQSQCLNSDELGWPIDSIEGATFAYLAYMRWNKKIVDMTDFTGGRPGLLGQVCI